MSIYNPDKWEIVSIASKEGFEPPIFKVMASWYGGYLGSDSWKLSSGIEKIEDKGSYYAILNSSGSTYNCYKKGQGASSYTLSVFANFVERARDKNYTIIMLDKIEDTNLPITLSLEPEPTTISTSSESYSGDPSELDF